MRVNRHAQKKCVRIELPVVPEHVDRDLPDLARLVVHARRRQTAVGQPFHLVLTGNVVGHEGATIEVEHCETVVDPSLSGAQQNGAQLLGRGGHRRLVSVGRRRLQHPQCIAHRAVRAGHVGDDVARQTHGTLRFNREDASHHGEQTVTGRLVGMRDAHLDPGGRG